MNKIVRNCFWGIFALFFIFQSCENKENKSVSKTDNLKSAGYKVTGKIDGLTSDSVFLVKLSKEAKRVVDTAQVKEDGSFTFSGSIEKAQYYSVRFNGNNSVDFVLDNEEFSFTTNATSPKESIEFEGSQLNSNIKAYVDYFNGMIKERNSLQQAYMKLQSQAEKNQDSLKILFDKLSNIEEKRDEFTMNFIDSIYPSKAIFFIVSVLNKEPYIDYQTDLSKKLLKEYPGSPLAKDYNETMEKILAQRKAMEEKEKNSKIKEGNMAPEISLPNPEGNTVSLSSLKGNYVLVDFWASWCGPCRAENPNVVKTFEKYKDKNFKIFSVSLDADKNAWLKAISKDNLDHEGWFHVSDLKYWQSAVVPKYQIQGIPYTLLLDKEGKIIAKNLRGPALEQKLKEVIGKES